MRLTNKEEKLMKAGVLAISERVIHLTRDRSDSRSPSTSYWAKEGFELKKIIDKNLREKP